MAKNSKPDNQTYLDPKKLRSFQTINRKASLVQDEGNKQKMESKEQFFSEFWSLKVIAQVKFYKKTTIKQTFFALARGWLLQIIDIFDP